LGLHGLLLACRDRDAVAYGRAVLVILAFWTGSSRSSGRVYTWNGAEGRVRPTWLSIASRHSRLGLL